MLRRAAGPLRSAAWKRLLAEPPRAALVPGSRLLAPARFASTQRETATQDSSLLRILKDEIDHEAEEYEPSRVRFCPLLSACVNSFLHRFNMRVLSIGGTGKFRKYTLKATIVLLLVVGWKLQFSRFKEMSSRGHILGFPFLFEAQLA